MIDDRELDDRIRDLPREIDPPADAWPQLAARIEASRSRTRLRWAAVPLAAAIAGGLWWGAVGRPRPAVVAPALASASAVVPAVVPSAPAPTAPVELIPGEGELARAATELASAYDRRRPLLDRDLLAVYEENLDIVDTAIERSRAALAEQPDDPHLQRLLDRAYHQKLALLRRASNSEVTP